MAATVGFRPAALLFLLLLTLSPAVAEAQIVLTELMQSNVDCVMDDRNEFPDSWVELHNTTGQTVDIARYRIGLTPDPKSAWQLPSFSLGPQGYMTIYADKEAKGLHTDFRLETSKGGAVYLFEGDRVVDSVTDIPRQPSPGVAYGRPEPPLGVQGEMGSWTFMERPSPRGRNPEQGAQGVLGEPLFSLPGGVTHGKAKQTLTLTLPEGSPAGAIIRYTTDGSEPTSDSNLYTSSINISTTTVIRARVFASGWISPRSTVRSFLRPDHEVKLPVVSIVTNNKYLNDKQVGIYSSNTWTDGKKNYEHDWRRPLNLELYEADGTTCALNQLCEGRIMGAASRGCQLKSLALYAHKRFGAKRFDYEFFPDQRPGETNYKSFLLRNAGNDFDYLYMRDAIIQRNMAAHTDIDWQAWRPAVVYINGVYRGILNIRDRSNDDNVFTHYDGLEDIDVVKNNWELQHGTWDHYNAFKNFYTEHGHTWDEYAQWMDLDEYINIMAMNLYYANVDFPGNNIVIWRPRTDNGRWRIIAKDTDYTLGIYGGQNNYDMLKWINNADYDGAHNWANQWDHTRLFRRLMEDMDFRREFTERMAIFMGDFLNERGTRAVWDPMYNIIKEEYPYHRALINRWWPNYDDELRTGRNWVAGRTEQFYSHLADYYSLGRPTQLLINVSLPLQQRLGVQISVGGVRLSEGSLSGKFFAGHELRLEGHATTDDELDRYCRMKRMAEGTPESELPVDVPRMDVRGWRVVTITLDGQQTTHDYEGSTLSITMPDCACLQITALLTESTGVEDVLADEPAGSAAPAAVYDLQGRRSEGARPSGIYLKRDSAGKLRKVVLR